MSNVPDTASGLPGLGAAIIAVSRRNAPVIGGTAGLGILYYALVPNGGSNFFVPVFIFAGLWLLFVARNNQADHRAFERHAEPRVEGALTTICGTATALHDAPGDILACRFQIFDRKQGVSRGGGTNSESVVRRYDGFYLAPTGIDTAEGMVRLAGFPDLIGLDKVSLESDLISQAKAAATLCPDYLPKSVARELVLAKVVDRVETSLKYGEEPGAARGYTKGWLLRTGDQVCVVGIWKDGTLGAIRNRPDGMPVYAGTYDEVREGVRGDVKAFFWFGGAVLAIGAALAIWSFF